MVDLKCVITLLQNLLAKQWLKKWKLFSPRMANDKGSGGAPRARFNKNGRLVFRGSEDFYPKRSLIAGGTSNDGLLVGFLPAQANPDAITDNKWSSYVILPSGAVINVRMAANSTGIHDRIPNSNGNGIAEEDNLNKCGMLTL